MRNFFRGLLVVGLALIFGTVFYMSSRGFGVRSIRNPEVMKIANKGCTNVDEYGNCLDKNYRSAYYRSNYYGGSGVSSRGSGSKIGMGGK